MGFEKFNVNQIINGLTDEWRVKLYESPRLTPKTMAELRSELARMEDVMPRPKANRAADRQAETPKRRREDQGLPEQSRAEPEEKTKAPDPQQ